MFGTQKDPYPPFPNQLADWLHPGHTLQRLRDLVAAHALLLTTSCSRARLRPVHVRVDRVSQWPICVSRHAPISRAHFSLCSQRDNSLIKRQTTRNTGRTVEGWGCLGEIKWDWASLERYAPLFALHISLEVPRICRSGRKKRHARGWSRMISLSLKTMRSKVLDWS